ncbi:carbohydrate binding domain-containing protein, partial [Clostridium sp. A1-XYC3]
IKNSDESAEVYRYDDSNKNLYNKLTAASRVQKFSKNYIRNHSVELNTSHWEKASWRGVSIDQIKGNITTEEAYMGTKSLKITKDTNSSRDFYQQWLSGLVRKKSYVLSAYVKTKDITKTSNGGAALFISYKDTSGKYNTFESTYIQGTNQWSRYYIRFSLPDNADTANVSACLGIIEESGTAYFDCIQLEEGNVPSRYSLVE